MLIIGLAVLGLSVAVARAQDSGSARPAPSDPEVTPQQILEQTSKTLESRFDRLLKHPQTYRDTLRRQAAQLPEAELYGAVYPCLAYVNQGLRDPARRAICATKAAALVAQAIAATESRMRVPAGQLSRIRSYRQEALYLGQLNLTLAAYRRLAGPTRHDALHTHLNSVLANALVQNKGAPLLSYPGLTWNFDTIPVVASLALAVRKAPSPQLSAAIAQHLQWIDRHGLDPASRLPVSVAGKPPRGCDLSLRLSLLPHIDAARSHSTYERYAREFWVDRGVLAGFAEWPRGYSGPRDLNGGPSVLGIGLTSTGLGLGAVIANGDTARLQRMTKQLAAIDRIRPIVISQLKRAPAAVRKRVESVDIDPDYTTGFLIGDAMLFYACSWIPWTPATD